MKNKLIISILMFFALFLYLPSRADNIEQAAQLYNDAIDLYKQDDINGSIELFQKAIALKEDFFEAHYNLAQILMSIDRNEEALKSLEVLLKLKPNDPETLYNIGKIQYKRGYLSNSYKHLKLITEDAPQFASAKLLIEKIEKRQSELVLEALISEHKNGVDEHSRALTFDLAEIQAPSGVAVDSEGNIFVASFADNAIHKISIYGKKFNFTNSSLIKGPIGIAIDKNNNIYVANYSANNILKITPDANVSIFASVEKPYCILYDNKHNRLYITEQHTNHLVKLDL